MSYEDDRYWKQRRSELRQDYDRLRREAALAVAPAIISDAFANVEQSDLMADPHWREGIAHDVWLMAQAIVTGESIFIENLCKQEADDGSEQAVDD